MSVLIFSNEWSKDTGQQNDSDGQQDNLNILIKWWPVQSQ